MVFSLYADFNQVLLAFSRFSWYILIPVLGLSYLNYFVRFLKWHYYVRILNIQLSFRDSYSIFMSGLVMSVTPGKMGELLKVYLVKELTQEPVSKTAPIVLVERITDFLSLILIAAAGAYAYNYGGMVVAGTAVFFITLTVFLANHALSLRTLKFLEKIPPARKFITGIEKAYESSYLMLRTRPLLLMTGLSLISWFFECLGYYIILINFKVEISLFWAAFSYGFSTIVGAIAMLPGGLGLTDGTLTFLVIGQGAGPEVGVASTFIIRMATLWFAVVVGIISIFLYQKRFGKINNELLNIKQTNQK
ncbi:MAG: flippase-like domain-containing protein [Ignavibacteriaceae bacterium]|nr:flippase-like domain-containing protein [Ignavibacteriaceae bacterium]